MKYPEINNFINGHFAESTGCAHLDVLSPLDGSLLSTVPLANAQILDEAVSAAKAAFPSWSATPIKERV
ncbi:MAG: aldehyde dehydrogenase family protein, partial [Chitinophagaceae bacterium]|nr:aldehyde dehydrogenase family protein [Chitinophagaceae bacterium]